MAATTQVRLLVWSFLRSAGINIPNLSSIIICEFRFSLLFHSGKVSVSTFSAQILSPHRPPPSHAALAAAILDGRLDTWISGNWVLGRGTCTNKCRVATSAMWPETTSSSG